MKKDKDKLPRIVYGSVLKPCDDVRSYQKVISSLANNMPGNYVVWGRGSHSIARKKVATTPNGSTITLCPSGQFARFQLGRLSAPLKFFNFLLRFRPELTIVSSPELVIVSYLYKILFGSKLCYDLQENYRANILNAEVYPTWARPFLSLYLSVNQDFLFPKLDGLLVAEKTYFQEMALPPKVPRLLLKNLFAKTKNDGQKQKTNLPFKQAELLNSPKSSQEWPGKGIWAVERPLLTHTGTMGSTYGSELAIKFSIILNNIKPHTLVLAGYSADRGYAANLRKLSEGHAHIRLVGIEEAVAHEDIMGIKARADLELMPYRLGKGMDERLPTKYYENLHLGLPMIVPPNPKWEALLAQYPAGLSLDFEHLDQKKVAAFWEVFAHTDFYQSKPGEEIYWQSQEADLLKFIEKRLAED